MGLGSEVNITSTMIWFMCTHFRVVQWPAKKVSHHLNVSVIKALITHLDFDVTEKWWLVFIVGHCTVWFFT
jgi:hypothetical protein